MKIGNALNTHVKSGKIISYADDTTIVVARDSLLDLKLTAQTANEQFKNWCNSNQLVLNTNKTVCMYFGKSKQEIMSSTPNVSLYTKFLGTLIDDDLSWTHHIAHVCKKLSQAYYILLKLKSCVDKDALRTVYYALAYPHLSYNVMVWGAAVERNRVFMLQKRLIRLIYDVKPKTSHKDTFIKNRILTFPSIYIYKLCMFVNANRHENYFLPLGDNHTYSTRNSQVLTVPVHFTAKYERSPLYNCVKAFNALPSDIRKIKNKNKFKAALKNYLMDQCFYKATDMYM
ncbi:uncharacterized protein LOC116169718 [Photinus pyralis]|uniref:uncharacterized protein LOC116169718 n=1 Tax=Photinus pyralis TaxID=7054 RepID=UPI00126781B5|nr:uncharacterized protein LOC116169718 [Photinus pyralis]